MSKFSKNSPLGLVNTKKKRDAKKDFAENPDLLVITASGKWSYRMDRTKENNSAVNLKCDVFVG